MPGRDILWLLIKIPIGCAIFAFFLPWITISLFGLNAASASGLQMAIGALSVFPASGVAITASGVPNVILWGTVICFGFCAFASFCKLTDDSDLPGIVIALAAITLVCGWMSTLGTTASSIASAGNIQVTMIQVSYGYGFWVLAVSLIVAIGICVSITKLPTMTTAAAADDTTFWDGLADKNDQDTLQEYLIRFPSGRFAELARQKLERQGVTPFEGHAASGGGDVSAAAVGSDRALPKQDIPVAPTTKTCPQCGHRSGEDAVTCPIDGAALV